jgi:hypothetical protein
MLTFGTKPKNGFIFLNTQSLFLKVKPVYHSSLGYFFISATDESVYLLKQGIFDISVICEKDIYLGKEYIIDEFKNHLDKLYSKESQEKKEQDYKKTRRKEFLDCDEYLDKKGKRDNRINEILK